MMMMMMMMMILFFIYMIGADVNWTDENKQGLSAIHLATLGGHSCIVKILIQGRGDVNAKDRQIIDFYILSFKMFAIQKKVHLFTLNVIYNVNRMCLFETFLFKKI